MSTSPSYKDMPLWQHAMRFALEIYQITAHLPASERLGLSASLQQSAYSIPALIASGTKSGKAGFKHALLETRRAAAEVETLLILAQNAYPNLQVDDTLANVEELQNSLTYMARRLSGSADSAGAHGGSQVSVG